jgi:hypothetical protein
MTASPSELQAFYDEAIRRWQAGEAPHPLAGHPLAVPCDGAEGCYTLAPIRDLSQPTKRYCWLHLPKQDENEE